MKKKLKLVFGPFSKCFLEQLEKQGLSCKHPENINLLYIFSNQALRMHYSGLITEVELDKLRRRIVKQVEKLVVIGETK